MNIVLKLNHVEVYNLFFFEKKRNVIIDGDFSKLVYSTPDFVMNGLYVQFDLFSYDYVRNTTDDDSHCKFEKQLRTTVKPPPGFEFVRSNSYNQFYPLCDEPVAEIKYSKTSIEFDTHHSHNVKCIHDICLLEESILVQYQRMKPTNKLAVYNLKNHLQNGCIKVQNSCNCDPTSTTVILKISGIWETDNTYGITFKFLGKSIIPN
jgi:hypothetical protein